MLLLLLLFRVLAITIHITVTTKLLHFRRSSLPKIQIGIRTLLNVLMVTIVRIPFDCTHSRQLEDTPLLLLLFCYCTLLSYKSCAVELYTIEYIVFVDHSIIVLNTALNWIYFTLYRVKGWTPLLSGYLV